MRVAGWVFWMSCVSLVAGPAGATTFAGDAPPAPPRLVVSWSAADEAPSRPAWLAGVDFRSVSWDGVPLPQSRRLAWHQAGHDPLGTSAPPARAFVYSEGYAERDRIHHWASYSMLPLFGMEAYLGQQLFNDPSLSTTWKNTAHRAVAWGIGGLFAINSVTGVWNMVEARKDPNGSFRRVAHGVLMLVADGGFVATAMTRPNSKTSEGLAIYTDKKNQHMALAYASVSVATVGYLLMLFK